MGFVLVTALVSGGAIFVVASLLEWILGQVAAKYVASFGPIATTAVVVSVATAAYVFVMTRPSIVGPYEQWTFANIGGQVAGGVLVAGIRVWMKSPVQS